MIKIGAQLYTIRDFTKTPEMIRESFKKIADIGYKCVQVSGMGPIDAKELDEIAKENGLEIVITHTSPDRILNDTIAVIEEHKIFGCHRVGVGSIPDGYDHTVAGYREFIEDFTPAAKMFKENGIQLYYHNHEFEFVKEKGLSPYQMMLNETDKNEWFFLPDVYWIQYSGNSPASVIKALKGRSDVIHIKDMATTLEERKQIMTPILEGNMDHDEIFDACKKAEIQYAMVEQDDCYEMNPFDALELSFNNLKRDGYIR